MQESLSISNFPFRYAVVDAARMGLHLRTLAALPGSKIRSLFRGEEEHTLKFVAPYLLACPPGSVARDFLLDQGRGQSWGIMVEAELSFDEILRHLRRLLKVKFEDGRQYYFRFYDPRVLRIFLPSCSAAQLAEVFGPVKSYITEDELPEKALRFTLAGGLLQSASAALKVSEKTRELKSEEPEIRQFEVKFDENTIV